MIKNDLKAMFLSGTLLLTLNAPNMIDNSFIASSVYTNNFECVKSNSNNYDSIGDSSSDVHNIKEIYKTKNNEGIIKKSIDLFGEMRDLTIEEESAYTKGLDSLSESTGVILS